MKILFNASMFFEKPTGVGIYTKDAWSRLRFFLDKHQIEYTVYSYFNDGSFNKNWKKVKLPFLFEIMFRRVIALHRLIWNLFYLPAKAKNYDLVYSFSSHGSPLIKKQIITIHDLICFNFPKQHPFQYFYFKRILPGIIKACRKVVVISQFTQDEVLKHYKISPEKTVVIYNGGDYLKHINFSEENSVEITALQKKINGNFFLAVGASYPHKNIEILIEAMQAKSICGKLVIAGASGNYYNHLKKLIELKKNHNIILLPYVSEKILNWLYQKCIANVYISLYEGFGFPPLEAAMRNKISVLSNIPVLKEVYNNAAIFADPSDINEIRKALLLAESDEFKSDIILRQIQNLVKKYSWEKTAEKIFMVINECM